jgi:hypothetical protein
MGAIEGWNLWMDSQEEYVFETSTPISYTFKEYSCAKIQDSNLIEAKKISFFINEIFLQLKLKDLYSNFVNSLKYGLYENDNKERLYKLSKKQLKQLEINEPYCEYLKTVKDTLNSFLSDTLTKIFQSNNDSLSSHEFILIFSKRNKLKKVIIVDTLFDYSKNLDFMQSREKIIKAFRKININFIYAKIGYSKTLIFNKETKKVIIKQCFE